MGTGGQETGAGGEGGGQAVRSLGPRMPRGTRMIFCPGCDSDLTLLEGARISSKPDSSGLKPSASTQKENRTKLQDCHTHRSGELQLCRIPPPAQSTHSTRRDSLQDAAS